MTMIKEVKAKSGFLLEVSLDNGSSVTLDLNPRLHTIRFGVLNDEELFCRAETDGAVISWGGKLEISAAELFELAQR